MSSYDLLIEKGMGIGIEKGMGIGIEKGIDLGEAKKIRQVVLNIFAQFPEWNDAQVAAFVVTDVSIVQQIRNELAGAN
jgi:hypothetical protein